jgi:hypothetical protein
VNQHVPTKICGGKRSDSKNGCGQIKPLTEFHLNNRSYDGHTGICKDCICALRRHKYNTIPEYKIARAIKNRNYKQSPEGKAKHAVTNKLYVSANRERYALLHIKQMLKDHGITNPQDALDSFGQLTCTTCGQPCKTGQRLCMDHCHQTLRFRGWLCQRCNHTLGRVGDNSALLRNLADYLDRAKTRPHA